MSQGADIGRPIESANLIIHKNIDINELCARLKTFAPPPELTLSKNDIIAQFNGYIYVKTKYWEELTVGTPIHFITADGQYNPAGIFRGFIQYGDNKILTWSRGKLIYEFNLSKIAKIFKKISASSKIEILQLSARISALEHHIKQI